MRSSEGHGTSPSGATGTVFESATSRWTPLLFVLIGLGAVAAGFALARTIPDLSRTLVLSALLVAAVCVLVARRAADRRSSRITINRYSIRRDWAAGMLVLPWRDIVDVRSRWGGVELRGRSGQRIRVDRHIENAEVLFLRLSDHLHESAPARAGVAASPPKRFVAPPWERLLRIGGPSLLIVVGWFVSVELLCIATGVLLYQGHAVLQMETTVDLLEHAVVIRRPLGSTTLPLAGLTRAAIWFASERLTPILVLESGVRRPRTVALGRRTLTAADAIHAAVLRAGGRMHPIVGVLTPREATPRIVRAALTAVGVALLLWGGAFLHFAALTGSDRLASVTVWLGSPLERSGANGGTPLYQAAKYGHDGVVHTLIAAGAELESRAGYRFTPLHVAAQEFQVATVASLLQAGADPNARNVWDQTPLSQLAWQPFADLQLEIAKRLVQAGADPAAADDRGFTPLHSAARYGNLMLIRALVDLGADTESRTRQGITPLSYAAERLQEESIRTLAALGAAIDATDADGLTPVHRALDASEAGVLQILVDIGADLDMPDARGYTALHRAIDRGSIDAVRVLVLGGADLDARAERTGNTALHIAVNRSRLDAVDVLLAGGASIRVTNLKDGTTPLTLSVVRDDTLMLAHVVAHGAPVDGPDGDGWTPLQIAARKGLIAPARALLGLGADPEGETAALHSPLVQAAAGGHVELARLLLEHGARPDRVSHGYTPMRAARVQQNPEVMALLRRHGAR